MATPRLHPTRRVTIVFLVLLASATSSGTWVLSSALGMRHAGVTPGMLVATLLALCVLVISIALQMRIIAAVSRTSRPDGR